MGRAQDTSRPPLSQRGQPPLSQRKQPSLAQRGQPRPGQPQQPESVGRPDDGKPCWVVIGTDRLEGIVHAWYRDESTGQWHALVVSWLPQSAVQPRTP